MNLLKTIFVLAVLIGVINGASFTTNVGEKREMPQYSTSYANLYRTVDPSNTIGSSSGSSNGIITVGSSAGERQGLPGAPAGMNVMFGPGAPGNGQYGPSSGISQSPPYPPYSYKDPGFSVQTGFEGYLVPNPWYGAISWGIEGIVVAAIGLVFVLALKAGLLFFLYKFFKFGKFLRDDDSGSIDDASESRSYFSSVFNYNNLNKLTSHVYDAIDKYNELVKTE